LAIWPAGSRPWTLLDYFPPDFLMFIDESHISIPQVGGMWGGDRARKEVLVDYGFRLPSALDNRPLTFTEFEERLDQAIYVSATPGPYETVKVGGPEHFERRFLLDLDRNLGRTLRRNVDARQRGEGRISEFAPAGRFGTNQHIGIPANESIDRGMLRRVRFDHDLRIAGPPQCAPPRREGFLGSAELRLRERRVGIDDRERADPGHRVVLHDERRCNDAIGGLDRLRERARRRAGFQARRSFRTGDAESSFGDRIKWRAGSMRDDERASTFRERLFQDVQRARTRHEALRLDDAHR